MVMMQVDLATEDSLSEQVGIKLLSEIGGGIRICNKFRKFGFGYLKSNIDKFCEISALRPVFLITDLDNGNCAPSLISQWLNGKPRPESLIFRVAVREVEAWLLADDVGMKRLLVRGASKLPSDPDSLPDPKRSLIALANRAPRVVRDDMIIQRGAVASQGLGYNVRMGAFVRDIWDPGRASERSGSLSRTRKRLREMLG